MQAFFPSPHYCSYQGAGREGRCGAWASRTDLLGSGFPASTNQHPQPSPSSPSSSRGRLLRNAPHQGGVLRSVKAVPKHGSPQHEKKRRSIKPQLMQSDGLGCLRGFFFFSSVLVAGAQRQKQRIVAYIQRCRGCERDGASHQSKRLRDGGRLQQTTWNDSFPRGVDKAGRAPSLVGQSVRVGS